MIFLGTGYACWLTLVSVAACQVETGRLAGDSPAALPEAESFRVATPRSAGVDCLLPGAPVPYFLILDDSLRQHTSSSLRPALWCSVNIPRSLQNRLVAGEIREVPCRPPLRVEREVN